MSDYGIIIASHSSQIAEGIYNLAQAVAKDVSITYTGGTDEGEIGTSFDSLTRIIEENDKDKLLAFFDLGSAKMNVEMAVDTSDKEITVYSVPVVEGAYTAAAMLQADSSLEAIEQELENMSFNK